MTDAKLKELVKLLTVRTAESKIHWVGTGTGREFRIEFGSGSITVNSWADKGKRFVHLAIFNKDGLKLEDFKFNDLTEFERYDPVNKLHAAIEKKVLKSEFIAEKIIDELK